MLQPRFVIILIRDNVRENKITLKIVKISKNSRVS